MWTGLHPAACSAVAALAPAAAQTDVASCPHPFASKACLAIWLLVSTPFVAAGGTYSLLSLMRRKVLAPSRVSLYAAIAAGFVYAFITSSILAVILDVGALHSSSAAVELFLFMVWTLVLQALYVRLVTIVWLR